MNPDSSSASSPTGNCPHLLSSGGPTTDAGSDREVVSQLCKKLQYPGLMISVPLALSLTEQGSVDRPRDLNYQERPVAPNFPKVRVSGKGELCHLHPLQPDSHSSKELWGGL